MMIIIIRDKASFCLASASSGRSRNRRSSKESTKRRRRGIQSQIPQRGKWQNVLVKATFSRRSSTERSQTKVKCSAERKIFRTKSLAKVVMIIVMIHNNNDNKSTRLFPPEEEPREAGQETGSEQLKGKKKKKRIDTKSVTE